MLYFQHLLLRAHRRSVLRRSGSRARDLNLVAHMLREFGGVARQLVSHSFLIGKGVASVRTLQAAAHPSLTWTWTAPNSGTWTGPSSVCHLTADNPAAPATRW